MQTANRTPDEIVEAISRILEATLRPAGKGEDAHGSLPTDWHFAPGLKPYMRCAGALKREESLPPWPVEWKSPEAHEFLSKLAETMTNDLSMEWGGWRFRLHAQIEVSTKGELRLDVKLRRIPLQLPSMKLPKAFVECCARPRGIILISGPTGSGKSTTLAKVVREHLADNIEVETYEHPIEYEHESTATRLIRQREHGRGFVAYSTAMGKVLRKDPDVIIPTELIDGATFRNAITTAETGHLVIGTLHLSNTPGVVARVIHATAEAQKEDGSEGNNGADARNNTYHDVLTGQLLAVLCQTLVPLREGGRIAAFELLLKNDTVGSILAQADVQRLRQALDAYVRADGLRAGSFTLEHSLAVLISLGRVSEAAAMEVAGRVDLMKNYQQLVTQAKSSPANLFDLYKNV